ncbi:hypothetical protein CPB83DRAFT_894522 [Crepidotus variabilis]|uniref:NmrA-like domain-containing protein n=1 Tax=Crepidotus variabilis TaxID=179855 RepID=A0A9P6JPJ9_9AGAR|nr:hypothetical protein CPB83DRAFT_894522 [Crepidotus variabilis]
MTSLMTIRNVLVAGASGHLGPAVLQELISNNKFTLFVLTRKDSSATFPDSVNVLKTDYTPTSLEAILTAEKIDAVISTLSVTTQPIADVQAALIDAAKASGVKRFIPSEFGSDSTDDRIVDLVPLFNHKRKAVDHLKSLQNDTFSWSSPVTGIFFDWGIHVNLLAINVQQKTLEKWDDGEAPFAVSNLATIGKALANLLSDSAILEATANKYVYISSHTITLNKMTAAIQKVTGETWKIKHVDSGEVLRNDKRSPIDGIKLVTFGKEGLGAYREGLSNNELLRLPKEDLEENLKIILDVKK